MHCHACAANLYLARVLWLWDMKFPEEADDVVRVRRERSISGKEAVGCVPSHFIQAWDWHYVLVAWLDDGATLRLFCCLVERA